MKYRCVSYPDLEPDHTWLRQILLFVDEIHRIVPADESIRDSDDLKRLMDVCPGAVQRCKPDHYVEVSEAEAKLFGQALEQPRFLDVARKKKVTMIVGKAG